ncbi:lipocalin-15 [Phocoena sinus]|uniref:lipocalin-15 n=1 Tax=Phocoena sinus TaxID=42100 RepID=UPI0013C4E6EB|nr:lipocalin-15 [Phocoena sinus]XP_032491554.1 lipocalin-15 [Phocoena sinus]XP_032491555.1 lipocalin-15 [Phocoena sinus]
MVSDCKVFRDKKDHLLTSTSNVKATAEGSLSVHMQLPGWTQEASPQALKTFQDFYPTVGLPEDTVVMLPKSDACSLGARKHPDSSGDPPWPFLGGGQGHSPLPSSRACACGLPLLAMPPARSPSEGCRCRSPPTSIVLPGHSPVCSRPQLTHHLFQGASPDYLGLP